MNISHKDNIDSTILKLFESVSDGIKRKHVTLDPVTINHTFGTAKLVYLACEKIGFTNAMKNKITIGALVHDLGMLEVAKKALNYSDPNIPEEYFDDIKWHPGIGADIFMDNGTKN